MVVMVVVRHGQLGRGVDSLTDGDKRHKFLNPVKGEGFPRG
jgi:hypothetical protein